MERLNKEAEDLRARGRARASPKAATERLSQEHHDARYRMARAKGVSHAKAWKAEKARRRAALNRRQGVANRAKSRIEHERAWTEHFRQGERRPEDRQDLQREGDADIPTVVVDKEGREVEPSDSTVRRPLTRKEKTYYREEGNDEVKPSSVPTVYTKKKDASQETRQKINKKRNERRKRTREKYAGKGKGNGSRNKRRRTRQQEDEEEEDETWGTWMPDDPDRDPEDKGKDWWKDHPGSGGGPSMAAVCSVEGEVSQISTSGASPGGGKVEVNFDTGAAVTVIPLKYGSGEEIGTETMFRTASGDAIRDAGPCVLSGKLRNGTNAELRGRLAPVHRVLASGTEVCKNQYAVLDRNGGILIPRDGAMGKELDEFMNKLVRKYRSDKTNATKLTVRRGVYCFDMQVPHGQPAGV